MYNNRNIEWWWNYALKLKIRPKAEQNMELDTKARARTSDE